MLIFCAQKHKHLHYDILSSFTRLKFIIKKSNFVTHI